MLSGSPEDHGVVFYARDDELVEQVTEYVLGAMRNDGVGVVMAAPGHQMAIEARLEQAGVNPAWARSYGSYVSLDAEELMSNFMINGFADPAGFWRTISPVIKKADRRRRRVAVFGEMVGLLWARGLAGAAVDLEALWSELASQYEFSLLCAYPADALSCREPADALVEVIAAHSDGGVVLGPGRDAAALLPGD